MNLPAIPLTAEHACSCGAPAVWATRRGPVCDRCLHPAHRRLFQAVARDAERAA